MCMHGASVCHIWKHLPHKVVLSNAGRDVPDYKHICKNYLNTERRRITYINCGSYGIDKFHLEG